MFKSTYTSESPSQFVQCPEGIHLAQIVSVTEGVQQSVGMNRKYVGEKLAKLRLLVEHSDGTKSNVFHDLVLSNDPDCKKRWASFCRCFHYWGPTHPPEHADVDLTRQGFLGLRGYVLIKHSPKKEGSGVFVNVYTDKELEQRPIVPRVVEPSLDDDTI
jgi:hypothetical protein